MYFMKAIQQKSAHDRLITSYSKYIVSDRLVLDFAEYFLWNIFNFKRIKVDGHISVNK